ncbi:unnamed protein product, partial [Meganyctiphanes norvegica]
MSRAGSGKSVEVHRVLWILAFTFSFAATNAQGDQFSGPNENVWSNRQCEYIVWYHGKSLSQCKSVCLELSTCTAFNYKDGPNTECVLWACPLPAPSPKSTRSPYKGYSLIPGSLDGQLRQLDQLKTFNAANEANNQQ